jgi:hypothetical protein
MVSRLARLCCWRQKFDVYNERLSSSLFSIPTGVGGRKLCLLRSPRRSSQKFIFALSAHDEFCFRHRSAFRLLVDVLLFSFQGSFVRCRFSNFINIPSFEIKVNNYFKIFFLASEGQDLIYTLLIHKSRGFLRKSLLNRLKSITNSVIPAITMNPPSI